MSNYLKYPTKKNTPSRKARKAERSKVFITNKAMNKKIKKSRLKLRQEMFEAAQQGY